MSYSIKNDLLLENGTQVPYVGSPNVGGAMKPDFLIIHYTASGPSSDIANYFSNPAAKVSAHLVVRRDGTIKQCVPFDKQAWHAGKSSWRDRHGTMHIGLNRNSIGIEIENWGPLSESGSGWVSWTGVPVNAPVIRATHKAGKPTAGWEVYTDEQIQSVIGAAQAICSSYKIEEIMGHEDISPLRKSDPGPAWKMDSFVARVMGRASNDADYWTVNSATGLNLRDAPSVAGNLLQPTPLPNGTKVIVHEASGNWRQVTVIDAAGDPSITGWVNGAFLVDV